MKDDGGSRDRPVRPGSLPASLSPRLGHGLLAGIKFLGCARTRDRPRQPTRVFPRKAAALPVDPRACRISMLANNTTVGLYS